MQNEVYAEPAARDKSELQTLIFWLADQRIPDQEIAAATALSVDYVRNIIGRRWETSQGDAK